MGAGKLAIETIISIHAPREGGDWTANNAVLSTSKISIHAPREGGDRSQQNFDRTRAISIHAPREGGDFGTV